MKAAESAFSVDVDKQRVHFADEAGAGAVNGGDDDAYVAGNDAPIGTLTTLQLVGIIFFAVAGGPYGFEDSIGAGGPLAVLIGLAVLPFVWSGPLALMTAELATMIPETGGPILWIDRAFGPFWSYLNGTLSVLCNFFDNALYPVLLTDYLASVLYGVDGDASSINPLVRWAVKVVLMLFVVALNVRGVDIVGSASVFFTICVISPFFVMVTIGFPNLSFAWLKHPTPSPGHTDWGRFLAILLWNTGGFDAAGTCAGEVADPGRSYPRALVASIGLITAAYVLPALIGLSVLPADGNYDRWHDGAFVEIAREIGGKWLEDWMGVSAAISAVGLLCTLLCTSSRMLYGMSSVGQLPRAFTRLHPVYKTPWFATVVNAAITLALTTLNFTSLAKTARPYKIPISNRGLYALCALPVALCCVTVVLCGPVTLGIGGFCIAIACAVYCMRMWWEHRAHGDPLAVIGELKGDSWVARMGFRKRPKRAIVDQAFFGDDDDDDDMPDSGKLQRTPSHRDDKAERGLELLVKKGISLGNGVNGHDQRPLLQPSNRDFREAG
eukprot:jgi/Chlat1/5471/Chrsp36S05428